MRYRYGKLLLSGILVVSMSLSAMMVACQDTARQETPTETGEAEFQASDLRINPSEATAGESIELRASVANRGEVAGVFRATLEIDNEIVATKDLNIVAGQSEDVFFSYTAEKPGIFTVRLCGLDGTFTINSPATFTLSSLVLEPVEIVAGDTVSVMVDISNTGDTDGTCNAVLSVDNEKVEETEVDVAAGGTEQVSFSYTAETPGVYDLSVNGETGILTVLGPETPESVEVSVVKNDLVSDFPDKVTFVLDCESEVDVKKLVLEYGTDRRSIVSEKSRIEPEFGAGKEVKTSWVWDMRKTGSLPPGATIWWQWRITHEDDSTFMTQRKSIVYTDDRYDWQLQEAADMDMYWHGIGSGLINELTEEVELKLSRIELGIVIPEERKPKIFVYPSSEELREAILFTQEWTGALAFPNFNIVLIPVNSSSMEWAKRTLAHEVTHLIVGDFLFGPFGEIPTWLNEGLAQYAEGEMEEFQIDILNEAIENDELISVKSLNSSFPTDPDGAYLAYAQSISVVCYLIDNYGWGKMKELLEVFKEGSTYDNALQQVYSFDVDGLEEFWKNQLT